MPDVEKWLHRASSGCGLVIWIDRAQRVVCLDSCSGIEPDGTLTGSASTVTDSEMIGFLASDSGRTVTLEQV